ncbi:DUF551 domain-containing protein [Salmonella enterica subsp. enterica serovar Poona]|nr:DUF551 domain-containing protein [Salmonella enterica subsp. enterica serovar Poona]
MNIDKRALREVAEKATKGPWTLFSDIDTKTFSIHTPRDKRCENVIKWGGFDCQPNAEANAEFIAAFNPKVALALLDENIQLLREKDAIEAVALALRDDMRQAREQLAAAELRNAELDERLIEYAGIATREARRVAELEARLHIKEQPAPVVPEEIEPDSNNTYDYVDGWNACRAAMLQGAEPVSQTYELNELSGNSPVTPDGWISCSERMPDKGQRVLVCVDFDSSTVTPLVKEAEYTSSTFRIGPNTINTTGKPSVTHWMPVPTAPEPETMNG